MSTFFKVVSLYVIALFSLYSYALEQALTKQKYPPYPEVWGYDLVDNPIIPDGFSASSSYMAPNGDVVFSLSKCREGCDMDPLKWKWEHAMLWFFNGKIELPSDADEYIKKHKLKAASYVTQISGPAVFRDGAGVGVYTDRTGTYCQTNSLLQTVVYKRKLGPGEHWNSVFFDEKAEKLSIIVANPNITRSLDKEDGLCDRGGPGGGHVIYKQLYPIDQYVWLGEDGFIAVGNNLIVRLDKNFNTKFKAKHDIELGPHKIKGNFFVLPYSKIVELDRKVTENRDHGVQGLHDELLLYLYERQEQNKNKR